MTAVYWDRDEYDCTAASRAIMHVDAIHVHVDTDRAACLALLAYRREYEHALRLAGQPPDPRYRCIRGPGGLIRSVVRADGACASDLFGEPP